MKKLQNNSHVLEKMEVMLTDSNNGTDHSLEQLLIIDKSEVKLESSALTDSNTLKLVKRKKALVINSKTKFEEYLEMDKPEGFVSAEEDLRLEKKLAKKLKLKDGKLRGKDDGLNMLFDGVPSVLDSLDTGETQGAVVVSRQSFEKGTSCKKSRNCLSSEEELDGEKAGDSVDGESEPWNGTSVRSCKMELNSLSNSNSTPTIIGKSKKTKFEEYLEMDMQKGAVPSEEDLALESKLAKKLKVKEGKLGGDDDDINMLFEGIPSILDSLENEEIPNAEEAPRKSLDNSSILRKRKKKASKQGADAQMAVDSTTVLSHSVKSSDAGMGLDKVPMKTSVVEGNAKYVAPRLRLCVRNVSEEHSQIRRHVRGMEISIYFI